MGQRLENAKALYLEAIQDGHAAEAIAKYSGARYTQHSAPVKDGPAGFIEFFEDFHRRNPIRRIEILRSFEDGQYVFLHVLQHLNNGEFRYVTADIFDTDDDAKLIEHWDVIAEIEDDTASGHSQTDGPTEPTDPGQTERNKQIVRDFLDRVLKTGDYDRLEEYVSTQQFTQHNPAIADGIAGLRAFLGALAERGEAMSYLEVHRVIGSGDLVAALSHVDLAGTSYAVIDLFRVDDGRIIEHWDVMEEMLPRDQWVNSGKF